MTKKDASYIPANKNASLEVLKNNQTKKEASLVKEAVENNLFRYDASELMERRIGSDSLWYILAVHQAAMAALGALGFVFIGSMSMDIVEQVEKSTDRREEGLLGTINAFVHKLVGAGGVLISGLIISYAGFDNPNALQADLYGGDIINNFALIHLAISISLPFISTLLVLLYDIDRSKHNTHVSDLGYVEED